ncbi:MAG: T9SS type A sorting domain-containing protein [Saprospiraceae bacterium]
MRKLLFFAFAIFWTASVEAQIFYYTNFNDGTFPSGWSVMDSRVLLSNEAPSSGYNPPPASGGNNVRFDDCAPISSTIRLIAQGVISTVGKTNIRVGFGWRKSSAWSNTVAIQWSINGSSWTTADPDVSNNGGSDTWTNVSYDLPGGADNQANLRFRFQYTTSLSTNCTAPPNFRIDDFAVGENFSLPVEMTDFNVRPVQGQARLSWVTAVETANAYFAVEHSTDGQDFVQIGQVAGAGSSLEKHDYTFWDKYPARGTNYYRLKQVDLGGVFTYGPIRTAEFGETAPVRAFPSPASDVLRVQFSEPSVERAIWEIYDLTGRLIAQGGLEPGTVEAKIPVQTFLPGTYWCRITASQQTKVLAFQKK